jgi:hypothetical protein
LEEQLVYARVFERAAIEHLDFIDRRHHSLIRATIAEQLTYQPTVS